MRLTVYLFEGNYYANTTLAKGKKLSSSRKVFSIERDIGVGGIKDLQNAALLKAQEMGINQIIGINA